MLKFNWAVIEALHHDKIDPHSEHNTKVEACRYRGIIEMVSNCA